MAHQLPGRPSSLSRSEMLCQGREKHHCSTQNGQHCSSGICEQIGGTVQVSQAEHHSQGAMALVHESGHHSGSGTSTRDTQHNCRQEISSNARSIRLDVESHGLPQDPTEVGSTCLHPD